MCSTLYIQNKKYCGHFSKDRIIPNILYYYNDYGTATQSSITKTVTGFVKAITVQKMFDVYIKKGKKTEKNIFAGTILHCSYLAQKA